MHAQFQYMNMHIFLQRKYFKVWILVILYSAILHKCIFGQADYQDLLKSFPKNFTLYFSEFYKIYYEFSNLNNFWKFKS
jgi:succinate dehydrogenase hydrophobic anchor subunit